MSSQGTVSNINGKLIESRAFAISKRYFPDSKQQVVVGKTIYGENRRVDIQATPNLHIECKFQSVRGSIDEKLPFLVETIKCHKATCVIVIEGAGWKPGAIAWLKSKQSGKLIVTNLSGLSNVLKEFI